MKKVMKIAALCLVSCLVASQMACSAKPKNDYSAIVRNLDMFNSLYKELNTFYVDSIDAQKSIERAINAMLDDIDPYTEYIPAKEQEEFMTISSGEYGGIGSYVMERKGDTYFSEPYEGSPAALAGVRAGDKIITIDGDTVTGLPSSKVTAKLKGQQNTTVHVVVDRPYVGTVEMDITRKKIQIASVPYYGVQRGNLGYIALTNFSEKSPQSVKDALIELKKNPNVKSIVLDLRGNGGGLLESAVQIVGLFVPKGTEVLQTRGKVKQNNKTYKTTQEPVDANIPLVVLVDGGSASSSEIVAGALQDLDRAVIVGTRSYGKGLVQNTRPLPFDGLLKVTVAKYYIPSGRLIQAIDYSRRNPDGSVARVPDSLTNVYRTANGREVRDGGGITPDIKVEYPKMNRLYYNILRDHWAFDFATKFAHENKSIPRAEDFTVTDSIYSEFKKFIDPEKFQYDKVCEDGLKQLQEVAESEGYMNDSTKAEFARLEKLLKHDINRDLDIHRKIVSQLVASEIIKRYYFQRGVNIQELKIDPAMDAVVELFSTKGKYQELLSPNQAKSAQKDSKKLVSQAILLEYDNTGWLYNFHLA